MRSNIRRFRRGWFLGPKHRLIARRSRQGLGVIDRCRTPEPERPREAFANVAFAADGRRLAAGSTYALRVFVLPIEDVLTLARAPTNPLLDIR